MKKRLLALLLCLTLCFTTVFVSIAATNASSKVTVSVKDLKPGYYLGAVWDGDELLTLFDYTVGSDGKLETVVDVGKTFPDGKQLKIGLSSENAGGDAIPPILYTIGSDTTPTASPTPSTTPTTSPSPTPSPSPSQAPSSQPSAAPSPSPDTPGPTYYAIYLPATTGGWVSASHTSATAGSTIVVTASPYNNYVLGSVYAVDNYGRSIQLTWQGNNRYTFTMPYSSVTITASFTQIYYPSIGTPSNSGSSSANEYLSRWSYRNGTIYDSITGVANANESLSRDILVSVLYNLAGETMNNPTIWAAQNKIVKNYMESGLQGPDMAISKDQTAFILYNYAVYRGCNVSARAAGVRTSRTITQDAYSWANAMRLFDNISGGPAAKITCSQAGTVLQRFINIVG